MGGGSAQVNPPYQVSVADGLRALLGRRGDRHRRRRGPHPPGSRARPGSSPTPRPASPACASPCSTARRRGARGTARQPRLDRSSGSTTTSRRPSPPIRVPGPGVHGPGRSRSARSAPRAWELTSAAGSSSLRAGASPAAGSARRSWRRRRTRRPCRRSTPEPHRGARRACGRRGPEAQVADAAADSASSPVPALGATQDGDRRGGRRGGRGGRRRRRRRADRGAGDRVGRQVHPAAARLSRTPWSVPSPPPPGARSSW